MVPVIRVYVPLVPEQVSELHTRGRIAPGLRAFAVTEAIRSGAPDGDPEQWEYLALQEAAADAAAGGGPVLVAAADVDPIGLRPGNDHAYAETTEPVDVARVTSFHLGDDVLSPQGPTPPPRAAGHRDDEAIELSWFDTTELAPIVRRFCPPE